MFCHTSQLSQFFFDICTEARNAYTYEEIDDCYVEAKKIAEVAKAELGRAIKAFYSL